MRRRTLCKALAAAPCAVALRVHGQPARVRRVAWLSTERSNVQSPNLEAFGGGLRALGYVEGRDLVIDVWTGDGSGERVEQLVPDLVRTQPDVVVAAGGLALFALRRASVEFPTVFSISADPVEAKIAASFARPGGNLTGISLFSLDLVGKRLELLKEVVPGVRRVALVANPQHPGEPLELAVARDAAHRLGLSIDYFPVNSAAELEAAFTGILRARDDAILAFADGFTLAFAGRIAEFSLQHRVPAIDGWAPFATAGNLMIYGPVIQDVYRRLAAYVDKILKGARPADLPIERPTRIELVINAKAAKALGLTIPPSVLARADEVIR